MVLEHQGLLGSPQSALQLYAAAAAHFGPRSRVPQWSPFLQFGMPNVFGNNPFLTRPRFGLTPLGNINCNKVGSINGSTDDSHSSSLSPQRTLPHSEDSNDETGEFAYIKKYKLNTYHMPAA